MRLYKFNDNETVVSAKKYIWIISGCAELIYGEEAKKITDDVANAATLLSDHASGKINDLCANSINSMEVSSSDEQRIYELMGSDLMLRALLDTGVVLSNDIKQLMSSLDGKVEEDIINFLAEAFESKKAILLS